MAKIKKEQLNIVTAELVRNKEGEILETWMKNQYANITLRADLINKEELMEQSREFLRLFVKAISTGNLEDMTKQEYKPIISMLGDISKTRATQNFTPTETATYIFSLQDAILEYLQIEYADQPEIINNEVIRISKLISKLGLVTFEVFSRTKEKIILNQVEIMKQMDIPVLALWEEILLLPIIGIVDSKRAQTLMELVLVEIEKVGIKVIIIDIVGVSNMDSAVANHFIKITKAIKLMGCESIISGISSNVAQTMVNLGIDMSSIVSTSTLRDAQNIAYEILKYELVAKK